MQLVFTKGAGKFDRLELRRADGTTESIDCPKQGIIPHDMVHFAVEAEVAGVGFLGNVAAGGDAGFGAADAPHARAVERLVETVQAEAWAGAPTPDAEFLDLYRLTCDARGDQPLDRQVFKVVTYVVDLTPEKAAWCARCVIATLVMGRIRQPPWSASLRWSIRRS